MYLVKKPNPKTKKYYRKIKKKKKITALILIEKKKNICEIKKNIKKKNLILNLISSLNLQKKKTISFITMSIK